MPWVRIDDHFDDSEDIDQMSAEAIALHVCGTTWSARNLTDGFIPAARVKKLPGGVDGVPPALLGGEKPWWVAVESGYQIRSFLKYNPSAETVQAERDAAKERMQRLRSGDVRANTTRSSAPPVSRIPVSQEPDTQTPSVSKNGTKPKVAKTDVSPLWLEWLREYPKRSGDRKCASGEVKFKALLKSGTPYEDLLAGVKRYRAWCDHEQVTGTSRVQQITTWLNGKAWLEPFEIAGTPVTGSPKLLDKSTVEIPEFRREA